MQETRHVSTMQIPIKGSGLFSWHPTKMKAQAGNGDSMKNKRNWATIQMR